jgi:CRP/FNR family transcriptional regulator, cyclic AMP receptor protein
MRSVGRGREAHGGGEEEGVGDTTVPVGSDRQAAQTSANEFLADLPAATRVRLLGAGVLRRHPRGETFFRASDVPARGGIVQSGLARLYLQAADGRRVSLRFARPGSMVGVVTALTGDAVPLNVQAVTDCEVLELPIERIAEIGGHDATFSWALAQEVSRRLLDVIEALADASFGTVRGRLVRAMLDLADAVDPSGRLVVHATNQALADSIGSVREVVARHIGELRDAGLVQTGRGEVTLLDAEELATLAGKWMPRRRHAAE